MQNNLANNATGAKAMNEIGGMKEVQTIKEDLSNLKDDAVSLVRDVKEGGKNVARESVGQIYSSVESEFHKIEERVKAKPGQSILLAFAAGLLSSVLLARR